MLVLAAVLWLNVNKKKKKLAKLKHYKPNLLRLIDCSNVYGDDYYSKDDLLSDVDKQIEKSKIQIAKLIDCPKMAYNVSGFVSVKRLKL